MSVVVADSSPLIVLSKVGHLDVLPALFGHVVIPPEVESAARPAARPEAKPEIKPGAKTEARVGGVEQRLRIGTDAALPAESGGRVTVRLIFEQVSWVEIKDRAGNTIFGQLNPAGSRRSINGEAPLSVVVGNAAGVRLFQGDKSIDLAPHTRVDVARLKLE